MEARYKYLWSHVFHRSTGDGAAGDGWRAMIACGREQLSPRGKGEGGGILRYRHRHVDRQRYVDRHRHVDRQRHVDR